MNRIKSHFLLQKIIKKSNKIRKAIGNHKDLIKLRIYIKKKLPYKNKAQAMIINSLNKIQTKDKII